VSGLVWRINLTKRESKICTPTEPIWTAYPTVSEVTVPVAPQQGDFEMRTDGNMVRLVVSESHPAARPLSGCDQESKTGLMRMVQVTDRSGHGRLRLS